MFVRSALLCVGIAAHQAAAHVGGNIPPSWWDPANKYGMRDGWRNAHVGPMNCDGDQCKPDSPKGTGASPNHWYSNFTFIPGEPVDADADWRTSPLRTYFWHDAGDKLGWNAVRALRKHPWRAPGQAPVFSPCGIAGGNPRGCPVGNPNVDQCDGGGWGYGTCRFTEAWLCRSEKVAAGRNGLAHARRRYRDGVARGPAR